MTGSYAKLERAKDGQSLEDIYNEGKDALYQWQRVGDVGQDRRMIDDGEVIQYREQTISLYEYEGEWYQAAIRRTNAGDELYLKSLRRADREQLERDRKRGRVIQKRTGVD